MPKFIIRYNAGYSDEYAVVEASTLEEAEQAAYEEWKEIVEMNADYGAEEYTEELAEDYGL
jgi:ferritin-like protein